MKKLAVERGSVGRNASDPRVMDLLETIRRLGPSNQDRMLRIVVLLADAPTEVQRAVQQMLARMLDREPASAADCIEEVDGLIAFLEEFAVDEDALWEVAPSQPADTLARNSRYN